MNRVSRPFNPLSLRALQGVNSFPSRFLARERLHVRPLYRDLWFFADAQPSMQPARFVLHLTGAGLRAEFEYARAEIMRLTATSVTRDAVKKRVERNRVET